MAISQTTKLITLIVILSLFFLSGLGYISYKILVKNKDNISECDPNFDITAVISNKTDMDKLNSILQEYHTKINSTYSSEILYPDSTIAIICIPNNTYSSKEGENYPLFEKLNKEIIFEDIYIEHIARP